MLYLLQLFSPFHCFYFSLEFLYFENFQKTCFTSIPIISGTAHNSLAFHKSPSVMDLAHFSNIHSLLEFLLKLWCFLRSYLFCSTWHDLTVSLYWLHPDILYD
jgi:hypothetical protein